MKAQQSKPRWKVRSLLFLDKFFFMSDASSAKTLVLIICFNIHSRSTLKSVLRGEFDRVTSTLSLSLSFCETSTSITGTLVTEKLQKDFLTYSLSLMITEHMIYKQLFKKLSFVNIVRVRCHCLNGQLCVVGSTSAPFHILSRNNYSLLKNVSPKNKSIA